MSAYEQWGLDSPSTDLDGDTQLGVPEWAQSVVLLWAIARARIGRSETARFRDVRAELEDLFADYRDGAFEEDSTDLRATWLSMGRSEWWSTDLRPGPRVSPEVVESFNSTGGLSPSAVALVRVDSACEDAVYDLVQRLHYGNGLVRLLEACDPDRFIEFVESDSDGQGQASWPGQLDSEVAHGSHELANAASAGEWHHVFQILDQDRAEGRSLVNTWRPGGVSWSTPLHQAARQGAGAEIVEALLARGAWRGMPDAAGLLPLDLAVREHHVDLVELLVPPETTAQERAVLWALEVQLGKAIELISGEAGVSPAPRFRVPPRTLLAESDGVLVLDLIPEQLALHVWVEADELFVAYWWDETDVDGSVYVFGPEGERREAPWDGTFRSHGAEVDEPEDRADHGDSEGSAPARDAEGDQDEWAEPDPMASSPIYSGRTIMVGRSVRFGTFYVLGPRAKHAELLRRQEAREKSIGILVRRTGSDCLWSVRGRGWRQDLAALAGDQQAEEWTDLVLFCALFKRNSLSDLLSAMAEYWAATGVDPLDASEFVQEMRKGRSESDVVAVEERWRQFVISMRRHGLAPTGAFSVRPEVESTETDSDRAESVLGAVGSPAKLGRRREFENALPMTLHHGGITAEGRWDGTTMLVLKGSLAVGRPQPGLPEYSVHLRKRLISARKLVELGRDLVFAENHRFESPSSAANVICGSGQNGRDVWRDAEGRCINDIEGGVKYVRSR